MSEDFVQKVFDLISLERNPRLWQSSNDNLTMARLELLFQFPQTRFENQLGRLKSPIDKNEALAQACFSKAQQESSLVKKLALLNQAVLFAHSRQLEEVLKVRIQCLQDSGHSKAASNDLTIMKVLNVSILDSKEPGINECALEREKDNHQFRFKNSVQIEHNLEEGRFLRASRDIEPGELIGEDAPVFKILNQESVKHFCWHCLMRLVAPIPCEHCSGIGFCSLPCRIAAQSSYHRFECGRTDLLYKSNIGVWILAARALGSMPDLVTESKENLPRVWQSVLNMESHEGSDQYSAPELMKEALVAVFLTRFLEQGNFSHSCFSSSHQGAQSGCLKVANVMHKIMRVIRFNCHEILAKQEGQAHPKKIGFGINPSLALINHSCDSNYGRVWSSDQQKVLAFATRPIKMGQQICDVYSGVFSKSSKQERREVHDRYHFQCQCEPCLEDWPVLEHLPKGVHNLPKQNYHEGVTTQQLKILASLLKRVKQRPMEISTLKEALVLAHECLKPPHLVLVQLEESLHAALWQSNF
ncbi:SET and MYND domain-containing protein DDB_G0273591-like [Tigriopus californicus]|uniref:SET and MYND domain-containing protein DDB_G0273591-like n=1 Tax=Tigriopus californicus TaxID=6832 RepID=UPI0027DA6BA9|nr:SET and MYND domain-containing protein DDB_G0273591-like [Tigriopus californicus]